MAIMQVPLGLSTHTNRSYVLTSHALFNQVASPPEGPEGGGGAAPYSVQHVRPKRCMSPQTNALPTAAWKLTKSLAKTIARSSPAHRPLIAH